LVTYTDKTPSITLPSQQKVDNLFLRLGWKIIETKPEHTYKDPINQTVAFSRPLPRDMQPDEKKRGPMKPVVFNTELIWGLVTWSLVHKPRLNYGTEDDPLFKLTDIYATLPDTLTLHMPPLRRMANLMKTNGEMRLTTVRVRKYDVVSVWKPTNPPKHVKLSPRSFLRNLKYELIMNP
jgi:hypothetical protein